MPSSSARCAQLPRAADKVPFYSALKKFRDYLNGLILELDDSEVVFPESSKPSAAKANGATKKPRETGTLLHSDVENTNGEGPNPAKKKRGRPRKGMEKTQPGKGKKRMPARYIITSEIFKEHFGTTLCIPFQQLKQ